jgi:hypothetical protein
VIRGIGFRQRRIVHGVFVTALVAAGAVIPACARPAPRPFVKTAKLGVFFGGEVQERREIPFELDPAKQLQGFRVEFTEPLAAETDIEWRIDMPKGTSQGKRRPKDPSETASPPRTTLAGKDVARVSETTLDHVVSFHPGDPLGLWNVRVVVRGKVVIDRPIEVFDPAARKRLQTGRDAGP